MFNKHLFSSLFGVLNHIQDYVVGEEHIHVFFQIIDQALSIMQLNSAFAKGLVVAIWKGPSWQIKKWLKKDIKELLDPLLRHLRADVVGCKYCEEALTTINWFWGTKVTRFFCESVKSEKCLRQIVYFAAKPQISLYLVTRRTVNEYILN